MKKLWPFLIPVLGLLLLNGYLIFRINQYSPRPAVKKERANLLPMPSPTPTPRPVVIAAVGDISLNREVNWQINQKGNPNFLFEKTAEIIKGADIALGNLEGPLIKNCPLTRKGMRFCGDQKNAQGLVFTGFDLLNLANNHLANYGPEGVQETVEILREEGIDYFGLNKISYQKINGLNIAFLGFNDTFSPIEDQELISQIEEAKKEADIVIVSFHWGEEYHNQPSERQRYLGHLAVDQGADLVIGHHPHVLQEVEYYQERPIIYSLGNFIFDQLWSQPTRIGLIALITIKEKGVEKLDFIPLLIEENLVPAPIPEPEKSRIINHLYED